MLEILKSFNYNPPLIKTTSSSEVLQIGPNKIVKKFEVIDNGIVKVLLINGKQWMMYNYSNHQQAAQLLSHYYLAKGDVITTGLGFGVRENWLLKNPNVKSITIIEKNQTVIDYHKKNNPKLYKKVKIICEDASEYKGECDTLLLDHYEFENTPYVFENARKVCQNIKCQTMWFWHLETQIIADIHGVDEVSLLNKFKRGEFNFDMTKLSDVYRAYEEIKVRERLAQLPNLSEYELKLFITAYTMYFQTI